LFRGICGGMGLLGVILSARLKLKKIETAYINAVTQRAENLETVMDLFEKFRDFTYSVAWIDCLSKGKSLGKSVLILGEHALSDEIKACGLKDTGLTDRRDRKILIPFNFPNFILNNLSVRIFNSLYYLKASVLPRKSLDHYNSFFFPLDALHYWNRIYGRRGFTQYQCVLPKQTSLHGMRIILRKIGGYGKGSFLAVLKLFGKGNSNFLSFPIEGYTLALDFPIRPGIFEFLDELDKVVLDHGGRLYLTKDARMGREMFFRGYPHAEKFSEIKSKVDKHSRLQSLQSRRIGL